MGAQSKRPDREVIRKMLDGVEAVTKSRFYEDPEPIASPVEMFLIRDGRPGGETFAQLSMREKLQVLGDYTDWQAAYEAGGISFEQLDQVFWNAAQRKPREQWLDGTGLGDQSRKKSLGELKEHGQSANLASRAEMEAFVEGLFSDGFDWPTKPGGLTRPGPEETPLQRVERQIGHIKFLPDSYDYRIEELGPWDTVVSDEWKRLPEAEKLCRLVKQVDWRRISTEDKRRLLEREVDVAQLPPEILRQLPDISTEQAGKLSLAELKERATERTTEAEHRKSRDKEMDR
jgi:hypothetical protein